MERRKGPATEHKDSLRPLPAQGLLPRARRPLRIKSSESSSRAVARLARFSQAQASCHGPLAIPRQQQSRGESSAASSSASGRIDRSEPSSAADPPPRSATRPSSRHERCTGADRCPSAHGRHARSQTLRDPLAPSRPSRRHGPAARHVSRARLRSKRSWNAPDPSRFRSAAHCRSRRRGDSPPATPGAVPKPTLGGVGLLVFGAWSAWVREEHSSGGSSEVAVHSLSRGCEGQPENWALMDPTCVPVKLGADRIRAAFARLAMLPVR